MIVGIPREVKDDEYRVAMTPAGVRELVSAGHTVYVEKDAGAGSSMSDDEFVRTGAKIIDAADDIWAASDLVCKVKEPIPEEYHAAGRAAGPGPLHLPAPGGVAPVHRRPGRRRQRGHRLRDGPPAPTTSLPLLGPMSEVAGRMAPLMGTHHLMRPGGGRGVLVCGVPGVRCAKVVILGAGVSGMAAATMAVGMHSDVYVLDRNLEKLRQVDHHFRGALETIASSEHAIEEVCLDADIVIGAVLVVGARAPGLVSDDAGGGHAVRFGAGRHLGRPGWLLRVDPAHHPLAPHLRGARIDLLLRGQHARGRAPHLDPRPGQCHPALHPGASPPTAGRRRCGPTPPWPRGSTWPTGRWSTSRWPTRTACRSCRCPR